MPRLILAVENGEPQVHKLRHPETRIGRAPSNDIHLDHERISRVHAVLTIDGPFVTIADQQSRNGTWVNGSRIDSQILVTGDEVRIGPHAFRFVAGEQDFQAVEARRMATVPGLLVDLDALTLERRPDDAGSSSAGAPGTPGNPPRQG